MGVYNELGLRTVINASGTLTRLGGSRMAPEVLAAMTDAAASFVPIDALQARAGEVIADITGAEAGYVVSGAAAGLSLGVAACVAGMDVAAMDRLPDTSGLKDEVVVQRGHRNAYDHAIRERTAALACPILDTPGTVPLPVVCQIAHERGVPVIVDAAAELPPRANLRRFIVEGADLVVFSGGKAIDGPQASGILAGRADLIASVALQHQDMDVRPETWSWRPLLDAGHLAGVPHQGFGRAMKVGREEIVGLITALRRFAAGSDEEDLERWQRCLDPIERALEGIPGIRVSRHLPQRKPVPSLRIEVDAECAGARGAYDLVNLLLDGEPAIAADQ